MSYITQIQLRNYGLNPSSLRKLKLLFFRPIDAMLHVQLPLVFVNVDINYLAASSNLHREEVLCHYDDNDSSSDEGSEFSTDQISLHEKSLSSRLSNHYLSTLREVSNVSHVCCQKPCYHTRHLLRFVFCSKQ